MSKPTPRTDAIVERLHTALEEPGSKAALARLIQDEFDLPAQSARNHLSSFLHQQKQPRSELTLFYLEFLYNSGH